MKKIYIILFLFFWCAYCGKAQYTGTNIQLPQQYQGSGTYTATGNINVSPTFNHNANPDGPINLQIKDPLSFEVPTSGTTGGPNGGTGIVGVTEGEFEVMPNGAATYTFSIFTPPGIAGIKPEIALVYNSYSNEGTLGKGWDIKGIGAVSRTAKTSYYNQNPGAINFIEDELMLDGQHLVLADVPKAGDYLYKKEFEDFSKINYYMGADYYEEYTKTGLIKRYGKSPDSRWELGESGTGTKPLLWCIDKIKDRNGNYMEFHYEKNSTTGELYISQILYTKNEGQVINDLNSINFIYSEIIESSNLKKHYYQRNNNVVSALFKKRLEKIIVKNGNNIIREYRLTYNTTLDGNNFLTQISEYNSNSECLNSLKFTYSNIDLPKYSGTIIGDWIGNCLPPKYVTGDLNNDGITDIVVNRLNGNPLLFLSPDNGETKEIPTNTYAYSQEIQIANVYNDGIDDGDDLILFNGNEIVIAKRIDDNELDIKKTITLPHTISGYNHNIGDFNGDGLIDLLVKSSGNFYEIIYGIHNGFSSEIEITSINKNDAVYFGDFDGDGATDILAVSSSGSKIRFTQNDALVINEINSRNNNTIICGDFNGDGKADIFTDYSNDIFGNKQIRMMLFAGDKAYNTNIAIAPYSSDFSNFLTGDFNNDGRMDLVGEKNDCFYAFITKPSGYNFRTELLTNNSIGYEDDGLACIGDFSGNGRNEILIYRKSTWNDLIHESYVTRNNKNGDLIEISNSLDYKIQINYTALTKHENYSNTENYSYPLMPFKAPLRLVKEVKYDNGNNGFFPSKFYYYENGVAHLQGKGFLGFKKFIIKDESTNIISAQYYNTDSENNFFFSPIKKESYILIDEMKYYIQQNIIKYNFKTYSPYNPNKINIKFPFIEEQLIKDFEIDGSLINTTKIKNEFNLLYGNLIKQETFKGITESNLLFSETIINDYFNYVNANNQIWILGKLKTSEITKKAPNVTDIVKNLKFDYYEEGLNIGRLKKESIISNNPKNTISSEYKYDDFGNLTESKLAAGTDTPRINTTFYDASGRFTDYSLNAKNQKTDFYYEPIYGNLITATDPNNLTTSYEYDGFGNLYKTTYPDGNYSVTAMRWASGHELAPANAVYYNWKQTTGSQPSLEFFDCMQRPLRQVTYGFKGETIFVDFVYDAAGRLEKQSEPYLRGATPQYIVYTYDRFQRIKTTTHPGNRVTTYYYEGLTQKVKNPKNQYSTKKYNAVGWLLESYDNANEKITYDYYADGLLKDMYDPNRNKTSIFYDDFRRKNKVIDPDLGTIEYGYNAFGEIIWQKENGTVTLQSVLYDVLGRVTEKLETESTIRYTYDTRPNGIGMPATYTYSYRDANGNSVTESRVYSYDALGRLITDAKTIDGTNYNFNYTYNQYNQPLTVSYPTGYELRNEYNAFGNLDRIFDNRNNKIWDAVNVDEKGKIKEIVTGNVVRTTFEFNPVTGYLTAIKSNKFGQNNNALQNFAYQWDAIGNLTMRKDANRNLQEDFTYDGLNRLRTVKLNGVLKQETRYDKLGNITYKSDVGSYNYEGPKPHAVTSINGSTALINRLNQNVSYTSFNKVCAISEENRESELSASMIILYGADHQRIKQVITDFEGNTTLKWHITPNFEKEIKNGRTKYIHYVSSPTGTVAHFIMDSEVGESINYILKDHLGSVQSVVDKNGNLLEEYSYDAWGLRRNPNTLEPLVNLNAYLTGRGFTGHEHIDLFALVNMNGRIYDPVIGRFMSADPYIQFPDYTQSLNRYSYCINNPLKYTDPSGYIFGTAFTFVKETVKAVVKTVVEFINTGVNQGGFDVTNPKKASEAWANYNQKFNDIWADFDPTVKGNQTNNAWQIDKGYFYYDESYSGKGDVWRDIWQVASRFTPWEMPQTLIGNVRGHYRNNRGQVESVNNFHGACVLDLKDRTIVTGQNIGGNYIIVNQYEGVGYNDNGELNRVSRILIHEYGHYMQSRQYGSIGYFIGGINSIFHPNESTDNKAWFERDAQNLGFEYLRNYYDMTGYRTWNDQTSKTQYLGLISCIMMPEWGYINTIFYYGW